MARSSALILLFIAATLFAGEKTPQLPHGQKTMPGPALSPEEAIAKMVLPQGFKVECICSEPTIVNPTAFTFDEKGRIWVCESVEYPRPSAGPGKDRIKMLESTKGDGKFDKATIIKEGLNIPCGIVMGNGGFYYTNSPDIVYAHLGEDGRIDKEEVILTGFGRSDRHELPNSLTWGPDGWLYGMNGVFNPTTVKTNGKTFNFTCAVWRWHPKTREFELFAEGTSNPWGLDYNLQGDWFVSCCVIKHLFHITQSGYYHRQGGPYPAHTHKIDDKLVAKEEHYMAANAGLCIYNGSAFPDEYKGAFLMGNLHGSQVNRDIVARNGSTYVQKNGPDFIDAQDKWFMSVSEKVGPDGCLYIMDWYDKYHCYQDSGRPDLDRERGRIYRVSYNNTPQIAPFDLKKLSDSELITMLGHPNQWQRREAQRLLNERAEPGLAPWGVLTNQVRTIALGNDNSNQKAMHATWLLCSREVIQVGTLGELLNHWDPVRRNWGVRMIGQLRKVEQAHYEKLIELANDPVADVRLQVPVAAGRLTQQDPLPILAAMLKNKVNASDPIIPNIIYNNLKPLVKWRGDELMAWMSANQNDFAAFNTTVIPWLKDCIAGGGDVDPAKFVDDLKKGIRNAGNDSENERNALVTCINAFNSAGLKISERAKLIDKAYRPTIEKLISKTGKQQIAAVIVSTWWNSTEAVDFAKKAVADANSPEADRISLIKALGDLKDASNLAALAGILNDNAAPIALRKSAVEAIGTIGGASSAQALLANFKTLPQELKPACINNLVSSPAAAKELLAALESKTLAPSDINSNNARAIVQLNDTELTKKLTALWGKVKSEAERDPARVQVVDKMRKVVQAHKAGDVNKGWKVFEKNCQQCHSIYGKGTDLGPNLTGVGRENLEVLLKNVLDPNDTVGDVYKQYMVKTKDGKITSGLPHEKTEKTLSLKVAGGKIEQISIADIALEKQTQLSLMPEELEKSMTEDEFCDLVAFLLTKQEPKP